MSRSAEVLQLKGINAAQQKRSQVFLSRARTEQCSLLVNNTIPSSLVTARN